MEKEFVKLLLKSKVTGPVVNHYAENTLKIRDSLNFVIEASVEFNNKLINIGILYSKKPGEEPILILMDKILYVNKPISSFREEEQTLINNTVLLYNDVIKNFAEGKIIDDILKVQVQRTSSDIVPYAYKEVPYMRSEKFYEAKNFLDWKDKDNKGIKDVFTINIKYEKDPYIFKGEVLLVIDHDENVYTVLNGLNSTISSHPFDGEFIAPSTYFIELSHKVEESAELFLNYIQS